MTKLRSLLEATAEGGISSAERPARGTRALKKVELRKITPPGNLPAGFDLFSRRPLRRGKRVALHRRLRPFEPLGKLCHLAGADRKRIQRSAEQPRKRRARNRHRFFGAAAGRFGARPQLAPDQALDHLVRHARALNRGAARLHRLLRGEKREIGAGGGFEFRHAGPGRRSVPGGPRRLDVRRPQSEVERRPAPRCPRCGETVQARAPAVLPKSLYGNQLVTQVVFLHFRQGIPMGRLCDQPGLGMGAVFDILHCMAALFLGVVGKLIEEYRQAPVRHAEETGRRTDGRSGYAWLFASATVGLFLFRTARPAQAPKEVLGTSALGGVLVVDRCNAHNQSPCALQDCYAHLARDVEDLAREFPGAADVEARAAAHRCRKRRAGACAEATDRGSGGAARPTLGRAPSAGHLP